MNELDALFIKEFKQAMSERRCSGQFRTTLNDLNIPMQGVVFDASTNQNRTINIRSSIPKTKEYVLQNIREPYFEELNYKKSRRSVSEVDRSKPLVRKKYNNQNKVLLDENGSPRTEDVSIPHGSIAVISRIPINRPYNYESSKGFEYVDFKSIKRPNGKVDRKYIYIVPKDYCYEVNFCALYITLNRMKQNRTFKTVKVTLASGTDVYLQVVKYKVGEDYNKDYAELLSVKIGYNFDNEIAAILNYWEENGFIFKRALTALSEPYLIGQRNVSTMNIAIHQENNDLIHYDSVNRNKSLGDIEKERKEAYSGDDLFQSFE